MTKRDNTPLRRRMLARARRLPVVALAMTLPLMPAHAQPVPDIATSPPSPARATDLRLAATGPGGFGFAIEREQPEIRGLGALLGGLSTRSQTTTVDEA